MAAIGHTKNITVADATGTVTYWNGATTASIAATNIVRPSDWNSAHYFTATISGAAGNTYGTSTFAGSNLVYGFTGHQYGSVSTAAGAATLWFGENAEPGGYTALTYQNRQLGASTTMLPGQNTVWMAPFRIAGAPVSASTLQFIESLSGTITSAATAQWGHTFRVGIYSQHTDPASTFRFDSLWSSSLVMTAWNSGTSSYSYGYATTNATTTGSSAGSNLATQSVMGLRIHNIPIGSVIPTGLYMYAIHNSTSSAGYTAAMSRFALVQDNPMGVAMGTIGGATNTSIGYVDGGRFSVTTAALPASFHFTNIQQVSNVMPWFKLGAL